MGEQCSRNCSAVETQMQYCWHNTFPFEIPITTAPWIRSRAKRLGSYFNVPLKTYWASTMVLWIDRELIQLSQYIDLCEIWWCAGVNKYINILYNIIYIYTLYIHIREREREHHMSRRVEQHEKGLVTFEFLAWALKPLAAFAGATHWLMVLRLFFCHVLSEPPSRTYLVHLTKVLQLHVETSLLLNAKKNHRDGLCWGKRFERRAFRNLKLSNAPNCSFQEICSLDLSIFFWWVV